MCRAEGVSAPASLSFSRFRFATWRAVAVPRRAGRGAERAVEPSADGDIQLDHGELGRSRDGDLLPGSTYDSRLDQLLWQQMGQPM